MDISKIMKISAAGLRVQTARMSVVAENLANADTVPEKPGETPYRRKIITFRNALDRAAGVERVSVGKVGTDNTDFGRRYDPGHPGADKDGFVATPNVKGVIEMMDLRAAQRSYEANLNVIQVSRSMMQNMLDVLR